MDDKLLKLAADKLVFSSDTLRKIGEAHDLEIRLPDGVNLNSFSVQGIITDCRKIIRDDTSTYIVEMDLCRLAGKDRTIYDAYLKYRERQAVLDRLNRENRELHGALEKLEKKLTEIIALSELMLKDSHEKQRLH